MASRKVRIGCASGFYGDSQLAARQLVELGEIDYLVFDYLAEVTMAILARAKAKDAENGYALDFVKVTMRDIIKDVAARGIKVVANAGGVNALRCARALRELCEVAGVDLKVAAVYGDDIVEMADNLRDSQVRDIATGQTLPGKLLSMNAYLGAHPIACALAAGADIVVTGRVVDSAVVLGPLLYEFGWDNNDYTRLAAGSLVGHVLECGCQASGGLFTDWQDVEDWDNMGYPIGEVDADGSFVVSKPPGTGGLIVPGAVAEQILYEIGDPANYLLPDVTCDFTNVVLEQVGENKVRVSGAVGKAPGTQYKCCATYQDGFRLLFTCMIGGIDAVAKGRRVADAVVKRVQRVYRQRGLPDFRAVSVETIGAEDTYGPHSRVTDVREVLVKIGLQHDVREALDFFAAEVFYLFTSTSQGLTGAPSGRARPSPMVRIFSFLIDKSRVPVTVEVDGKTISKTVYSGSEPVGVDVPAARGDGEEFKPKGAVTHVPLIRLAWGRSGDKGDICNVGIIARRPEFVPLLRAVLTKTAVAEYFAHICDGPVERFELPGINAFNFVLHDALGGGGTGSLRMDPQGKAAAQMLLSKEIAVPAAWLVSGGLLA